MARFGYTGLFDPNAEVFWKTEGLTDALAIMSLEPPPGHLAACNACGAGEKPDPTWCGMMSNIGNIFNIHDNDPVGQAGATWVTNPATGRRRPGWAPAIAAHNPRTRNVILPPGVNDVRDWICERLDAGRDRASIYAELLELARSMPLVEPATALPPGSTTEDPGDGPGDGDEDDDDGGDGSDDTEAADDEKPTEAPDDPHRLARINLATYLNDHGGVLKYWRQQWWKYRDGKYREISDSELHAKVIIAVKREFDSLWREEKDRYEKWLASKNYDEKSDKGSPVCRPVKDRLVSNVVNVMKSLCIIPSSVPMPCWLPTRTQRHFVATSNGIVDMDAVFANKDESECLLPHSPEWFSAFRLDYPFNNSAKCPLWIKYLNHCMDGDQQRINVLQEWAGYLLTSDNYLQRFLALEGEGGNGKTVYFTGITAMLGEENVSNVSLENFGDRFALTSTIGKAANISGDVGETDNIAEGVLKQFTGGGNMQFDRKNRDPISVRPTAKLMCAWNTRPRIKDKTNGMWRRMIVVPFNRAITKDERVVGMDQVAWWMQQGEVPGILRWAIAGLDRLREQGDFTESDVIDKATEDYKEEVNPTLRFLKEYVTKLPPDRVLEEIQKEHHEQVGLHAGELYEKYKTWCTEEGVKPLSKNNLGIQVKRRFGDLKDRRKNSFERYSVYRLLRFKKTDENDF